MKIFRTITWFYFILILSFYLFPTDLDKNLLKGYKSIRPMDPYNYCKTISSERYAGRLTGHEGYTSAANWAAGKFKEWKLIPISKKEGYLQVYPSPYTIIKSTEMTLLLKEKKKNSHKEENFKEVKLEVGKDFLPVLYSDKGSNKAGIIFAGWGICAPDIGYDDYAEIDVSGKFVLCFRGTPDRMDRRYTKYDHHRFRMQTAKKKGALGLFYIYKEPIANPNGDWIKNFTPAILSEKTADIILKEKRLNSKDLKKELLSNKKPRSFSLNSIINFKVESEHFPKGIGYNIVGYVEGSDPVLKKTCLVIGGHFDHCGLHMGFHFAGANDNASGSAVVMEIAEAFSKLKKKPKRSVIFVLFGGEEMGLMGSYYFADHLPKQFKKIDAMFNFDMVGEGDGTVCVLSPDPPQFKRTLEESDKYIKTLRRTHFLKDVGVRSSDYAPFFFKGASCISFFSNGPHLHYHKTGDTIYRINPDIMADIARLAFLSAFKWANR